MPTPNANSMNQHQYDSMSIGHFSDDNSRSQLIEDNEFFDHIYRKGIGEDEFKALQVQNLSQKMSHLSTNTTVTKSPIINNIQDVIEKVPDYLTKRNPSLQQILHQALSTITTLAVDKNNSSYLEPLRHIAILIYKILLIQAHQALWTTYLKSGTGQLITPSQVKLFYSTADSVWPKQIKTLSQSTDGKKTNHEQDYYLKFVQNHLYELEQRLKQVQMEVNLKAKTFQGFTLTIQKILEGYIEGHLQSLRMEIANQIELIHYDYHIRSLKLEYIRHQLNAYQERIMNRICQSKYEQEITEQEHEFLKKQIAYYHLPNQSYDASLLSHSPLIDSIENPSVRQALQQQFKQIAEQSRTALFNLYLQTTEDQRKEYKKKYETDISQMQSNQYSDDDTNKLSPIMIQIINERCEKISERIKCIYKFKTASIT